MTNSLFQTYVDYVTKVSNVTYDAHMNYITMTQSFMKDAIKQMPVKDIWGAAETWANADTKSKK